MSKCTSQYIYMHAVRSVKWRACCEHCCINAAGICISSTDNVTPSTVLFALSSCHWMLLWYCCSIFKTSTTRLTVPVVPITRRCLQTMALHQCRAVASMTLHSRFYGHSLQHYMSLAECLEPLPLDSLQINLAGKLFEIVEHTLQLSRISVTFPQWQTVVTL